MSFVVVAFFVFCCVFDVGVCVLMFDRCLTHMCALAVWLYCCFCFVVSCCVFVDRCLTCLLAIYMFVFALAGLVCCCVCFVVSCCVFVLGGVVLSSFICRYSMYMCCVCYC